MSDYPTKECNKCGADIIWTKTIPKGKWCPMDVVPSKDGGFEIREGLNSDTLYAKFYKASERSPGEDYYVCHFETCGESNDAEVVDDDIPF